MNGAIYKMEMLRNLKSFIIWSGSIGGILFFGMLFFPAINADGLLNELDVLFENPMMKGMLSAFGADVSSLGSLTGFYVTYNSIYNVLLGCIFASLLAGNLLAKEEADRTADFLFTKPVSRGTLFLGKAAVLHTYIILFCLFYFLVSLMAMETVKKDSPDQLILTPRSKKVLIEAILAHPAEIYPAFNLNQDSFASLSLSYGANLMAGSPEELREMNLNQEDLDRMLEEAALGPETFFEQVLTEPEDYMAIFSVPPGQEEEFLNRVRTEQEEYRAMEKDFFLNPDLFLMFFNEDPSRVLSPFLNDPGSFEKTVRLLELPADMGKRIFRKYSPRTLVILCIYVGLLIGAVGSVVLFISLLMKRGKSVLGAALGMVFFFYFLNSLTSAFSALSPLVSKLAYLSPFTWMDTDFSRASYGLHWWRVLLFGLLSGFSLLAAYRLFCKKDILL